MNIEKLIQAIRDWRDRRFRERIDRVYFQRDENGVRQMEGNMSIKGRIDLSGYLEVTGGINVDGDIISSAEIWAHSPFKTAQTEKFVLPYPEVQEKSLQTKNELLKSL